MLLLVVLLSSAPARGDDEPPVVFVNVNVVSMQDDAVLPAHTVLVEGDRIRAVGPVEAVAVPPGAVVIDGTGRYLMPGLADMHVHVRAPFADGPLYLDAGITTVLNLGTLANAGAILEQRDRSRTPAFVGPTLYTVGPLIHAGETADEAERLVRVHAEGGYDVVKVYGDVSPEAFARLHAVADDLGLTVTGHAQRQRGMQPIYAHRQDLAHVEEYLYAAFNPATPALVAAINGAVGVLVVLVLLNAAWALSAGWRRVRKDRSSVSASWRSHTRWMGVFSALAWLLFIGLWLTLTPPLMGALAGNAAAISVVGTLTLAVAAVAAVVTWRARRAWGHGAGALRHVTLLVSLALIWIYVACAGVLVPRSWRTTGAQIERVAGDTAAAGIWVTPTLVAWDYITRQAGDEFASLVQRPAMRYLRPATRDQWIHRNRYTVPPAVAPMVCAARQRYQVLLTRLVGALHEAGVPLLAGSDVGAHGVLPGSSLHEELALLVDAGLSPYEALRTATVNAAAYLESEDDFGRVAAGLRADLVLVADNPLEDVDHVRSRLGVMRRGRWFGVDELNEALERLAEERK